jgi:hypothetical protein
MTRWKAAAIHLSISAFVGLVTCALLFGVWYPPPFFHAGGADELVLLLVGVDLTLGPLLTLIVFRSGKRGLKFDLAIIGLVQFCALVYGMNVVLESRPIFLVGVLDRFELVAANEVSDDDLEKGSTAQFRTRSWRGPVLVGSELPSDPTERGDLAFAALHGRDVQYQPKYYREFSAVGKNLLAKAKPLAALKAKPGATTTIATWLERNQRAENSVVWLPVVARKGDLTMLLDATTGEPLQALAIDPW